MEEVEVVIRLSKFMYNNVVNYSLCGNLASAVREGTVLPKGHGDLVDRKSISYENTCVVWSAEQGDILECNAPTIIKADKAESEGV